MSKDKLKIGTIRIQGKIIESATIVAVSNNIYSPTEEYEITVELVYIDYDRHWQSGNLYPRRRRGTFKLRNNVLYNKSVPMTFNNGTDIINEICQYIKSDTSSTT